MKTWFALVMMFSVCAASSAAVEYTGRNYRDPFGLTVGSPETMADTQKGILAMKLQGIVWHTDKPRAIINNKMVKVGSRVGEAEVIGIDKEGVRIQQEGQEFVLRLSGKGRQ